MPAYKDEKRKSWYCSFYYTDFQGNQKRKVKRGFAKKEEAKEWERNFLTQQQQTSDISFDTLCEHYLKDCKIRLKPTSHHIKETMIDKHIRPYFGKMALSDITPLTVRNWQNDIINQNYSQYYQRNLHECLSIIMNFAVSYFGLKENPCHKSGPIGKRKSNNIGYWSTQDLNAFLNCLELPKKQHIYVMVNTLFWTGMRIGELLALTPADIDTAGNTITISKSYRKLKSADLIQAPKTENSQRTIDIPKTITDLLTDYISKVDAQPNQRIFEYQNAFLGQEMKKICDKHGLKHIRVHDLRHSHASFLINNGFSPLVIKERLGHDKIETTLQTYSHLYPSTKEDVITAISNAIVSK